MGQLLIRLEDQIDDAYATCGLLGAALVDARRQRRLSAVVGQQVFRRTAEISNAIGAARGEVVDTHRLLEQLAKRLELRAEDYGDGRDKPNG